MTTVSFPILRLPESALQESLKLMSMRDQLSVSVLSKKTEGLITVVNNYSTFGHVKMTSSTSILLSLWNRSFTLLQSNVEIREYLNNRYTTTYLDVPGFTEKQWFKHITDVFFRNQCTSLEIANSAGRSIEEICEYTKELQIVGLRVEYSLIQNYELLKLFPSLRKLNVYGQDPLPKSILTHSLEGLELSKINLTLDDLLALNHSDFSADTDNFFDNDMNLFLKHWIKGSNPNLERFNLYRSNHGHMFNEDIFKGIEGIAISSEELKRDFPTRRIFEIKRHDGTKAVCDVDSSRWLYISMLVK